LCLDNSIVPNFSDDSIPQVISEFTAVYGHNPVVDDDNKGTRTFKDNAYEEKLYVYQNRLNKVKEYTAKLYIQKLEGKVLFNPELEQKYDEIFGIENKISNEIRFYLENMKGKDYPFDDKVVYDSLSDDDPISIMPPTFQTLSLN